MRKQEDSVAEDSVVVPFPGLLFDLPHPPDHLRQDFLNLDHHRKLPNRLCLRQKKHNNDWQVIEHSLLTKRDRHQKYLITRRPEE